MPTADFFERFGLFIRPGFVEPDACRSLRSEMHQADQCRGSIYVSGQGETTDESARSVNLAQVAPATMASMHDRFRALLPALAQHFSIELAQCEEPQFLLYREGDHFAPHRDTNSRDDVPEVFQQRKVVAVAFLNGEGGEDDGDSYAGGSLTFYELLGNPSSRAIGFPLVGETGLMVAFPSSMMHEVRRISRGERYAVTTFYS